MIEAALILLAALVAVAVVSGVKPETVLAYVKGVASQIEVAAIGGGFVLRADAAQAFLAMRDAASAEGIDLKVDSAFRSEEEQQSLWDKKQAGALTQAVAQPGWSNHQGGVAIDIDTQAETYGKFAGPVYDWLTEHGAEHGFSNDEGRSVDEPWHWVYTGSA